MRLRTVRTTANRNKLMILFLFLVVNNYKRTYNKKDGTADNQYHLFYSCYAIKLNKAISAPLFKT